jgi:hypothetical protein
MFYYAVRFVEDIPSSGRYQRTNVRAMFSSQWFGEAVLRCSTNLSCGINFSKVPIFDTNESFSSFPVAARSKARSTAARLLRSWVRIPPVTWIFVCWVYCVLSGRGLYDELITRPERPADCGASLCVIKNPRDSRKP